MKNITKKAFISVLGASLLAMSVPSATFAETADIDTAEFNVRIEGINECLYYETVSVPKTNNNLTAADVLEYADNNSDELTITGLDTNYITDVNGDTASTFGGYDGWLYRVNNTEPTTDIASYDVSDGDSILLYYGDPYGVGMQYPELSFNNQLGFLIFTSKDAIYDADYNLHYVQGLVADLTVKWTRDGKSTILTTDKGGKIQLPDELLAVGEYQVEYYKTNADGIPLVLRSEPNLTVTVDYICGDITGDRYINAVDASIILSEYANIATGTDTTLSDKQQNVADVDSNGSIDAVDASKVLSYYAFTSTGGSDSFESFLNN